MADEPPPLARQMSLIPYAHDAREIVLYVSSTPDYFYSHITDHASDAAAMLL